jgi:hypothetical protein
MREKQICKRSINPGEKFLNAGVFPLNAGKLGVLGFEF